MTNRDVEIEIVSLADLDLTTLREKWHVLWGSEPPTSMSRELLRQSIAYKVQVDTFGALPRAVHLRLLRGSANGSDQRPASIIKPGTRLLRSWQGQTHEVTVTPEGTYAYQGAEYRSLSAIARKVTGTRWSGPAFFGLKPAKGKRHGKA